MSAEEFTRLHEQGLSASSYSMLLSAQSSLTRANMQLRADGAPIRFEIREVPAAAGEPERTDR